ncbi:MAG: hypothetical protein AAF533_17735 [Acidobacteriota bacterium]
MSALTVTFEDIQRSLTNLDVDDKQRWSRLLSTAGQEPQPSSRALDRLREVHRAIEPLFVALQESPLLAPRWRSTIESLQESLAEIGA